VGIGVAHHDIVNWVLMSCILHSRQLVHNKHTMRVFLVSNILLSHSMWPGCSYRTDIPLWCGVVDVDVSRCADRCSSRIDAVVGHHMCGI
jgi:intracellular septation protein A